MSGKRKDNKGRVLRQGETQRSDGKYEFKYTDSTGKRHSIYSWKLVESDKVPPGKKCSAALREMEKKITRDAMDGIFTDKSKESLDKRYKDFYEMKSLLKATTRSNYDRAYNLHIKDELGHRAIGTIKYTDIKKFYLKLLQDKGISVGTLGIINNVLSQIFTIAVRDNIIRVSPTTGVLAEIKRTTSYEQKQKAALTIQEQEIFLAQLDIPKNQFWKPLFVTMLGTGLRAGEIAGLRWEDCDFKKGTISINHNLTYVKSPEDKQAVFRITSPKTCAGIRTVPMFLDVRSVLLKEKKRQMLHGMCAESVDGYSGFIFTKRFSGKLLNQSDIDSVLRRIIREYNEYEIDDASYTGREPVLLPPFTAHILRHTFCTRLCENTWNIKLVQEVMGHSDAAITMNIYNSITQEQTISEFASLEGKIKLG